MNTAYNKGYLKVDQIHELYYECHGNPSGKNVLVFHGGPGYGCDLSMLRPFDLGKWNVVLFDQRGAGKSKPAGELQRNSTQYLIEDVKLLVEYLHLDHILLKGESWGTTLALLFAEKYPECVAAMLLTGVFLGNNDGTLLGLYGGFEKYYPDLWDHYLKLLPPEKRSKPYNAYYEYIVNGAKADQDKYSRELIQLELLTEMSSPDMQRASQICDSIDYVSIAKIESHYTVNDFFVDDDEILKNIYRLNNIPVWIVQGRHDLICPLFSAWQLATSLKKCTFTISEMGAHSDFSGNTLELLKKQIESIYKLFTLNKQD